MSLNPKVVPFDRGADFVYQRAMKNQRENNIVEALELMRKAVAQSPENATYALELAELLSETGCRTGSNRLLLDMLVQGREKGRCLYYLAMNMLGSNDPDTAKRLLRMCQTEEDAIYRDQARNLSGEIEMYESLNRPANRRQERVMTLSDDACEKMRTGDHEAARRLFGRALEKDDSQRDVQAMMAMACMLTGDREAAIAHAERAVSEPGTTLRALCVSAQVYAMAEDENRMRNALIAARELGAEGMDCYMLIFSLFEAGMYAEAKEEAIVALRETPYDRLLMHVTALSILNLGENKAGALKYWQKICRIDPEDTVAEYYLNAVKDDRLDLSAATCEYQVPRDEMFERFKFISDRLNTGYADLVDEWLDSERFRRIVGWCLISEDSNFRELAVAMLASFDDETSESMLREFLSRPDTEMNIILRAAAIYQMRGKDLSRVLPLKGGMEEAMMPDGRRIMDGMSVGHRQLVRLADDMLKKYYDIAAFDRLSVMWEVYRSFTSANSDPMTTTETAAAALAYCYLKMMGEEAGLVTISAQFDCSLRQLKYYVKHLTAVLEKGGAPVGKVD